MMRSAAQHLIVWGAQAQGVTFQSSIRNDFASAGDGLDGFGWVFPKLLHPKSFQAEQAGVWPTKEVGNLLFDFWDKSRVGTAGAGTELLISDSVSKRWLKKSHWVLLYSPLLNPLWVVCDQYLSSAPGLWGLHCSKSRCFLCTKILLLLSHVFSVQVTDKSYFIAQWAHLGEEEKFNVSCSFSLLGKPLGRQAQKMCSPGGEVPVLGTGKSWAWMQPSCMCCHMGGGGRQGRQEIFNTV